MHQFPEREVLYKLVDSLDCKVIGAMQVPDYYNVTMTHNIRTMGLPFAHVMVESLQDVQKVVVVVVVRFYIALFSALEQTHCTRM